MWIEINDEINRKVLINLDYVQSITESGEETNEKYYLFLISVVTNNYWVFSTKEEKDEAYKKIKNILKINNLDCNHEYDFSKAEWDPLNFSKKVPCKKCKKIEILRSKL